MARPAACSAWWPTGGCVVRTRLQSQPAAQPRKRPVLRAPRLLVMWAAAAPAWSGRLGLAPRGVARDVCSGRTRADVARGLDQRPRGDSGDPALPGYEPRPPVARSGYEPHGCAYLSLNLSEKLNLNLGLFSGFAQIISF